MTLDAEIDRRIRTFVAELDGLVREQALAAVAQALGGGAPAPAPRPAAAAANGKGAVARLPPVTKGQKRDPRHLARLVAAVRSHVAAHPGQGVEHIAKQLGVATKDITLPITKLLAAKEITRKGQRRGTRYFARH